MKKIKTIKLAKSAGFCFGVKRAMSIVKELLSSSEKIYTLGPLIHNPQVVDKLRSRGVEIISDPHDIADKNSKLVIRSHGISQKTIELLDKLNIQYVDATCPFVKKIHNIVNKKSNVDNIILIAGEPKHPEVEGIVGHCPGKFFIFESSDTLLKILKQNENLKHEEVVLVAQTTFNRLEWEKCLKIAKDVCTNIKIFDTICNATLERQIEAENIAKESDVMLVIGGKCSSNTNKLKDICAKHCKTYLIETVDDIPHCDFIKTNSVGITAGASTPNEIIVEVMKVMDEKFKKQEQNLEENEQESFAEMLEESLKNFNTDDKVIGTVVSITPTEVYVDVGRKQAGFIPTVELSNEPNVKPEDVVKVGDQLELLIMKTNDQEGTIMLSKRRVDSIRAWDKIVVAADLGNILTGTVKSVVKGGIIVTIKGCNVFVPASHTSLRRHNRNLENMIGQKVDLKIIEVNKFKRRAIGSIKVVLEAKQKELEDAFWADVEIGKIYTGTVKSITNYGAFVSLGDVDGMIHISELSWTRIKHPTDVVHIGDTVEVYIKDLDIEKRKISLGYKRTEDNPWEILRRTYKVGDIIDVKIVSIAKFGAFASVLPGVDGLIHISQIANQKINSIKDIISVGDTVKVLIQDIDFDRKRIGLSIRALAEPEVPETVEENESVFDSEKVTADENHSEAIDQDSSEQDTLEQASIDQDSSEQNTLEQDSNQQELTESNPTEHNSSEQDSSEQELIEQNPTEQASNEQDSAEQIPIDESEKTDVGN